jgi:bifunctional UDP-N-acetylglucosamine pyrophosphorylase / glucosamine-1-phosphate N-acetyltransferase
MEVHVYQPEKPLSSLILAAGKGTRMKSDLAKVLHPLRGRPLLDYSLDVAREVGSERIAVVIGHQAETVRETFSGQGLIFVEQREQLGTGHAVLMARDSFRGYEGTVLILCGDVPLLRPATIIALYEKHRRDASAVTVMTVVLEDPVHYGRVVKNEKGEVVKIVEMRDATEEEKRIREINTGIYCAEGRFLFEAVGEISNDNAQKEYYLTDIIEIAGRKGYKAGAFVVSNPHEVMGINTPEELELAARLLA